MGALAKFAQVVAKLARYGKRAVDWAWSHKGTVIKWINAGAGIEQIVQWIRSIVGA